MLGFGHFLLSAFAALTMFTHHSIVATHPHLFTHSSATPTPTQNEQMITATGDVSEFGETAHLSATFPANGGVVKGTISGDCTGTVHGQYSGDTNGKNLSGTATAQCPVFFFDLHGTATFSGTVNDNDTSANVNYTAHASGKSKTGTFTFSLRTQ